MEYLCDDQFLIQAADPVEDPPAEKDTGTNEPVTTPEDEKPEDQPDEGMAQDLTNPAPAEGGEFDTEIETLKKQVEELQKKFDLDTKVDILKKRLDNISIPDDSNVNDSIYQSSEIKYIKRAIRRLQATKTAGLTGAQQQLIITELDQHPNMSTQAIAAELAPKLKSSEQDIFDFIRNTDYRFRHRHFREASVIDWESID